MRISEVIGPHQGKEIDLLLSGEKSVAIANLIDIRRYKPYLDSGKLSLAGVVEAGQTGTEPGKIYFITRRGEEKKAQPLISIQQRIRDLGRTTQRNKQESELLLRYHKLMGKGLGYSDQDVQDFADNYRRINNINEAEAYTHSVEVISKYSDTKTNTLNEIETIPGKEYNPHANEFEMYSGDIEDYKYRMKPLPGNSGLTYVVVNTGGYDRAIYILDSNNLKYLVGELKLEYQGGIPNNTLQAALVRVHPKYRGRGIAKALYGLALLPKPEGLGLTIVSDTTQTPGGVRNWVSLSKIPGVEVTGVVAVPKGHQRVSKSPDTQDKYAEIMADLLGKVGGFYYGETIYYYFYQIPVDLVGSKLENTIKSSLIKMYFKPPIDYLYHTFLMAKYGGVE